MINRDYLYTERWKDLQNVRLGESSLYLFATDKEIRSEFCFAGLQLSNPATAFVQVELQADDMMNVVKEAGNPISLNDQKSIKLFFLQYAASVVYIEVTGMSCRMATPLLLAGLDLGLSMYVVYTEPFSYKISQFKKVGINKDLSESVEGINPLPGMARIIPHKEDPLFVTLLGFEGGRLSLLLEDVQPSVTKIIPIFGIPGYKPHYPLVSYLGNKTSLRRTRCWMNAEYAEANSIVDAYVTLTRIWRGIRGKKDMIVAPVGTKPHAIGAILFAIKHKDDVELLYDNPKRNVHRTEGIGKVFSCNVSKLISEI